VYVHFSIVSNFYFDILSRWDWVVILLVLYTGIITPYTISFLSDEDQKRTHLNTYAATRQFNRERTSIHVLVIIDVLVDFMFIFDILISFRYLFFCNNYSIKR
jgi:p-aminobenzoyl-glutamate transporter AbgT